MNIIVSVKGRFHAFNMAQQLFLDSALQKLITSYPKFEVKKYGIPERKIDSFLIIEIIARAWQRLPGFIKQNQAPDFFINDLFDRLACGRIEKSDIFIGWSSFSLHSLRRAKKLGAITILERGSSHILFQQRILKDEYEKFGIRFKGAHPKIVEKELREYEESDYIEVLSSFSKRTFLELGIDERKIIQTFIGVNLSEFRQVAKEDNIFRVIYCGYITLRKGIHYLLQAFYELKLSNAELWLIGTMNEEMRPFINKYDNGKILCKGPYQQRELYKYYSQGSVFVLASIEEGAGMVIPQAMACGLPVICTNNTAGEDMVRNGRDGFVIPIRDVEALKEKLLFFYEKAALCRVMGESAKNRVINNFSWGDYGKKIINIYSGLLK